MSHRASCPTEWEARSEGARAFNRGGSSWNNPYRDGECEEAESAWRSGFRRAEQRQREEEEERRYYEQLEQEQLQAEYERSLEAAPEMLETEERGDDGHPPATNAEDSGNTPKDDGATNTTVQSRTGGEQSNG